MSERLYPIQPLPEDDARFTFGLTLDVAAVLKARGYPSITNGGDFLDLQQALYRFLYVGEREYELPVEPDSPPGPSAGELAEQRHLVDPLDRAYAALAPRSEPAVRPHVPALRELLAGQRAAAPDTPSTQPGTPGA
ncbi:hypothetical protein ACFUJR_27915 [Streptomyces sp. NPDC057271]|uniref:hypothetical protein n=1 Tax=unclassified Streptomyces TaxID=2593676 RepID=UPI003639E8E3